jgi:predicted RNase H-like HicB family nuclease
MARVTDAAFPFDAMIFRQHIMFDSCDLSKPATLLLMLKTLSCPLTIERSAEDAGYLAYFPALLWCQTWGDTYEAAVRNAKEALAAYIETLAANGDPIPEPGAFKGTATLGVMVRADIAA